MWSDVEKGRDTTGVMVGKTSEELWSDVEKGRDTTSKTILKR